MNLGFELNNDILVINPKIYCDYYIKAFSGNEKIYGYKQFLNEEELEQVKKRIIKKFIKK